MSGRPIKRTLRGHPVRGLPKNDRRHSLLEKGVVKRHAKDGQDENVQTVHASIHNHFNHQRHLNRRDIFKQGRAAALAEWRQLAV